MTPLAFGFTVTLNERTDTVFSGQALSLAVTVKLYGSAGLYTHLTLPTIYSVQISADAAQSKKTTHHT